jgi:hypothetical protein
MTFFITSPQGLPFSPCHPEEREVLWGSGERREDLTHLPFRKQPVRSPRCARGITRTNVFPTVFARSATTKQYHYFNLSLRGRAKRGRGNLTHLPPYMKPVRSPRCARDDRIRKQHPIKRYVTPHHHTSLPVFYDDGDMGKIFSRHTYGTC